MSVVSYSPSEFEKLFKLFSQLNHLEIDEGIIIEICESFRLVDIFKNNFTLVVIQRLFPFPPVLIEKPISVRSYVYRQQKKECIKWAERVLSSKVILPESSYAKRIISRDYELGKQLHEDLVLYTGATLLRENTYLCIPAKRFVLKDWKRQKERSNVDIPSLWGKIQIRLSQRLGKTDQSNDEPCFGSR